MWHTLSNDLTDHERFGFEHFHELTGPALQAILPSPEWVRLAKQVSVQESAVFHAVAAVGTMARGLTVLMHPSYARPVDLKLELEAARQYGKAISLLRRYVDKALAVSAVSTEPILLACLLCVCFEIFRGRNMAAMQHARQGWKIVEGCKTDESASPCGLFFRTLCQQDPDASALLHDKNRHHSDCCQFRLPDLPTAFLSVEEAGRCLAAIGQASEHFRYELLEAARTHPTMVNVNCFESEDASRLCLSACLSRIVPMSIAQQHRWRYLRQQNLRWHKSFTKLEQAVQSDGPEKKYLRLRIQYFYSNFCLATCRDTEESLTDRFGSEFQSTLDIIERFLELKTLGSSKQQESSALKNSMFFGSSVLPCLGLIAYKCRDPVQRRRALSMLFTANKREGLEDSGSMGYYAQAVAELEQQRSIMIPHDGLESHQPMLPREQARFCDVVTIGVGARGIFRLLCARYVQHAGQEIRIEMTEYEGGAVPLRQTRKYNFDVDVG